MNESNNSSMGFALAFVFAICLILVGVIMMNVKATGIDNHISRVDDHITTVETKVDDIAQDVELIKYGQQLLAAGQGQQPIVVTVK